MNNEIKELIMNEINEKSINFSQVGPSQYRIRCPICGDSQKNIKDAHCYIKCDYTDPFEPILYNCFKCNSSGVVNEYFLKQLGIDNPIINENNNHRYNRVSFKKANVDVVTGDVNLDSAQAYYVNHRLDRRFTKEDFEHFKIVWDINILKDYITNSRVIRNLPNNLCSISFLSDDKSVLLSRSFDNNGERWTKLKLFPSEGKSMYTLKYPFDVFNTDSPSILYIAEGIFDILSIYGMNDITNSAYIAVLGSDYGSGIEYAISKGIIGKSINVVIFIDSDIDHRKLSYSLKKYKWMYNRIDIAQNTIDKDIGVPQNRIKLSYWKV